jgi:polar amino acid transport system permease protein
MTSDALLQILAALASGAVITIAVSAGALAVAVSLGFLLAATRFLVPSAVVRGAIATFIELFRNVPSLTYLFLIYFGLAYLGIRLSSLAAAILALGLIGAAVLADVFRAGFQAIDRGQREAALAVGLSARQCFVLIVVPQALRVSLPPLGNYAISLVKDTSLVAAIAAPEIMFNARQIVNQTIQTSLTYGSAALLYLLITYTLGRLVERVERSSAY